MVLLFIISTKHKSWPRRTLDSSLTCQPRLWNMKFSIFIMDCQQKMFLIPNTTCLGKWRDDLSINHDHDTQQRNLYPTCLPTDMDLFIVVPCWKITWLIKITFEIRFRISKTPDKKRKIHKWSRILVSLKR